MRAAPLAPALLDEAAALLAARHRRDRSALPLLPAAPEDPAEARRALDEALARPHASGHAAVRNGRLRAFLVGDWAVDELRGRAGWVRLAGHASEPGDERLLANLYAGLAEAWVAAGCFEHLVLAPAGDAACLDTWYGLEFGRQQVHGVRDLAAVPAPRLPAGVEVRRAGPADLRHALALARLVQAHQAASPVFAPAPPELADDLERDYAEVLGDPAWTCWLALEDGRPLGFALVASAKAAASDLLVPEGAAELKLAATVPEVRGRGVGHALAAYAMQGAAAAGASVLLADWRSANLLASRFWPAQGFLPAAVRLHRTVDARISWAR